MRRALFLTVLAVFPIFMFGAALEQWEHDWLRENIEQGWYEHNSRSTVKEALDLFPDDKDKQYEFWFSEKKRFVESATELAIANIIKTRLKEEE